MHETFENGAPLVGMRHFRVELDGVELAALVSHRGNRARRGRRHLDETSWQFHDGITVAHPDLEHAVTFRAVEVGNVVEQCRMAVGANFGVSEFTGLACCLGGHDLAAQLLGHGLHAVANSKHRNTELENDFRRARRVAFGHRTRPAGEDDALGAVVTDEFVRNIVRMDFAEDLGFAHTAGDQLGNLRTEIEDEDFLVSHFQNLE